MLLISDIFSLPHSHILGVPHSTDVINSNQDAVDVMVIGAENKIGESSSNPCQGCLPLLMPLEKAGFYLDLPEQLWVKRQTNRAVYRL